MKSAPGSLTVTPVVRCEVCRLTLWESAPEVVTSTVTFPTLGQNFQATVFAHLEERRWANGRDCGGRGVVELRFRRPGAPAGEES